MMRWVLMVAALAQAIAPGMGDAQPYPAKPVQMVVSFPPGSGSDGIARIVATKLGGELGQAVVVLNRAGASGLIAAELVANAVPDGHTLFLGSASVLTFNTATFAKLPYDPVKSFAPIGMIGKQPFVIAVSPTLPVKSLAEFVALAKAQPGKYTYGNTGSSAELAVELFCSVTGIQLLGVPYKGGSTAAGTALMVGEIDLVMDPSVTVYPQVAGAKPRFLAATSAQRSSFNPELPTVAESGYPGFDVSTWWALLAPAGTPPAIIELLHEKLRKVLAMADVKEQLAFRTVEVESSTPAQLRELIVSEGARWRKTAQDAGIKPQ
jgi:tripartite-type tricarboxylate transporter receptor subunit TctC